MSTADLIREHRNVTTTRKRQDALLVELLDRADEGDARANAYLDA
jgi:hypothetical protein